MENRTGIDESNIHKGYDVNGFIQVGGDEEEEQHVNVLSRLKKVGQKKILLVTPTSDRLVGVTKWLSANLGIERLAGYLNSKGHLA